MTNVLLLDPRNVYTDEKRPSVIWGKEDGIIYQDLDDDLIDDALDFIRRESIANNILLRSFCAHTKEDVQKDYLERARFLMSGGNSLVALDTETNEILGIVIMFPMIAANYTWPMISFKIWKTYPVEYYVRIIYELVTSAMETEHEYNFDISMHYFKIAIANKMVGKFFRERLLLQAYKVARSIGAKTITWVCCSKNDQERARRVGLTKLKCFNYREYKDDDNKQVFQNVGRGENTACLFAATVGEKHDMSYLNDEVEDYLEKHKDT